MAEVSFYHLQRGTLEAALPQLLTKVLERGWRAVVQAGSAERQAAIDDHLWTFRDDSFLPHTVQDDADAPAQPVVICRDGTNPNAAQVRFLVDGAALPEDMASYERVLIIFNGNDDEALARARDDWRRAKGLGAAVTYWQQDENGSWRKKA